MQTSSLRAQFNGLKDLIDATKTINAAQVDAVNTLPAGDPASVNLSVSGGTLHFSVSGGTLHFSVSIPQRDTGPQGNDGPSGPQGPPGEVTQWQLNTLNQTSANTNNIITIDTTFADPDMEAMRQKLNGLILNGRR
jgi:hypothetical protein